jgi:8-oxo-dGTP pyrophosphatase MutT (NUDIX family)
MLLVFSDENLPATTKKSIFLEGPSPRSPEVTDWRPEAVQILQELNYDGIVYIPIPRGIFLGKDKKDIEYDTQIPFEKTARKRSDVIVSWVARVIDRTRHDLGMPGFTTNFELAEDMATKKVLYGRPDTAEKCKYLDTCATDYGIPIFNSLHAILTEAVHVLGDGAVRTEGEVNIPLLIWRTRQFQSWYGTLRTIGNKLLDADVKNAMMEPSGLFSYILAVKIWIAKEDRIKDNEFVFARPDISVVVAHHKNKVTGVRKVALVKEFRSPVRNYEGYVFELAGGSSRNLNDTPDEIALHEISEELGLCNVDPARLQFIGMRQLVATVSSHCAYLFSLELTDAELAQLEAASEASVQYGVGAETERTFVVVSDVRNLFKLSIDFSMLGMISEVLMTSD